MKNAIALFTALTAISLLSGCNITRFSTTQQHAVGRELLDLHEAHTKKIISDAEYARLKSRLLASSHDTKLQQEGNNKTMVHVIAFIKVKPEHREEFTRIFKANIPNVLAEDGCIQYTLTADTDSGIDIQTKDPNILTVIEKWSSREALQAHLASPHMKQYGSDTEGMTEGLDLRVLEDA
ncbi:putative quinol monooxygenase [Pontiella agarivorans]|uniref:Quinol monooxygenase n=1 Tax=Pontiella agarivorans TaxID=3038953 RepID=A0ABU5MZE0_9BACT|nr:putative quinol monooxygenase [Pontiella agarivorans]MDZ8119555.1 putative quinol monooxygenase [Pontiella agarivorans]